jgi:hypothetical protein
MFARSARRALSSSPWTTLNRNTGFGGARAESSRYATSFWGQLPVSVENYPGSRFKHRGVQMNGSMGWPENRAGDALITVRED